MTIPLLVVGTFSLDVVVLPADVVVVPVVVPETEKRYPLQMV
jgi:hypothetical protein